MNVEEQALVDIAKATKRLMETDDYKLIIEHHYISAQLLALGKDFDATMDEIDTLKAITHLQRYLTANVNNGKIILDNIKSN